MGKFDNYPEGVSEDDFNEGVNGNYTLKDLRAKARMEHFREMLWEDERFEYDAKYLDKDLKKCDT